MTGSLAEILKAAVLGTVEGLTEWLPVSSTGHMILVDEFLKLGMSDAFKEMFLVVVQLGAIMAVVILYWKKLFPFRVGAKPFVRKDTMVLWIKILIACVPAALIGIPFNDQIDAVFYNYQTVAVTLVVYGILFLIVEARNRSRTTHVTEIAALPYRTALLIGAFQLLSLIPGTSRSGATILGAILLGTSRAVAAEFSFFLAVPVMFGASLIKLLKFGFAFTGTEAAVLATGLVVAFGVSVLAIRFLVAYVQKHDFRVFGWYRIALGLLVFGYFIATGSA
jgi:undecaprenyl-diphosphatase